MKQRGAFDLRMVVIKKPREEEKGFGRTDYYNSFLNHPVDTSPIDDVVLYMPHQTVQFGGQIDAKDGS